MNIESSNIRTFIDEARRILNDYVWKTSNKKYSLKDVYDIDFDDEIPSSHNQFNHEEIAIYLGTLYERLVPLTIKKDLGQFYTTNSSLIDIMLQDVDLLSGKILEPSCGTGFFIVNIAKKIIKLLEKKNYSSEEILNYVQEHIYGNDIDSLALQISEINLLATLIPHLIKAKNNNFNYKLDKFHLIQNDFTKKESLNNNFSLVIGNPPFITMYGKRSRNMTEEKRAYYNTFDFVQNKQGNNKFNLSMFFIENGLYSLVNDGQLIFILDIAFFETAYIDLRKFLVQNYCINFLIKGFQAFEGVASGQIILSISNTNKPNKQIRYVDIENGTETYINQETWNNQKQRYKFSLPLNKIENTIVSKLESFPKLDYYFPGKSLRTCCALTGRTDDFVVDKNDDIPYTIFPYIEGSKGLQGKFEKLRPTKYIKYDYDLQLKISDQFKVELEALGVKNKKRVTLGDKEAYLSPKLFIRQSATEIISTYTEEPLAANNSIYILSNKINTNEEKLLLKYTCGILNSNLTTYYCRINRIIRMDKGKTPQIKTSDLKNIRINVSSKYFLAVVELVDQLLISPDNKFLLNQLNRLVYSIYNITEEEISYIESSL